MTELPEYRADALTSFLEDDSKVEKILRLLICARIEYLASKDSTPYTNYSVGISVLRQMRGAKNRSYFRAFYPEEIQILHTSLRLLIMQEATEEDKRTIAELYYALQASSPVFDWSLPRFG